MICGEHSSAPGACALQPMSVPMLWGLSLSQLNMCCFNLIRAWAAMFQVNGNHCAGL